MNVCTHRPLAYLKDAPCCINSTVHSLKTCFTETMLFQKLKVSWKFPIRNYSTNKKLLSSQFCMYNFYSITWKDFNLCFPIHAFKDRGDHLGSLHSLALKQDKKTIPRNFWNKLTVGLHSKTYLCTKFSPYQNLHQQGSYFRALLLSRLKCMYHTSSVDLFSFRYFT